MTKILARPLTAADFAPFGEVLDSGGQPDISINNGTAGRWHDRARMDFGRDGHAGISIIVGIPRSLPHSFDFVERHPDGSQAFLPMTQHPFLVIVAKDEGDRPGTPLAFVTAPGQGINFRRGTWHGVLTPLHAPGLFAAVDRIGPTPNCDGYTYPQPWTVISEPHA